MKIRAQKFVLHAAFDKAAKVVPSKDIMPVLKNFYVQADSLLRVASTDLELSLVVESQLVEIDEPGTVILPSKKIMEIMAAGADAECTLQVTGDQCSVYIGTAQWELTLMQDPSAYPPLPSIDDVHLEPIDRSEFLEALGMVYRAAGRSTARPNLMLLNIADQRMTGTDGARCQQVSLASWPRPLTMQIPIGAVDELVRLLRSTEVKEIEVGSTEDHLIFKIGQDIFVANSVVLEFPEINRLLIEPALGNDLDLVVDREELQEAVRRVRVTADPETSAIVMSMDNDTMSLSAQDKYQNTAMETITCRWEHEPKSIAVNHSHLSDMLESAEAKSCAFFLSSGDTKTKRSPLLLKDESRGMTSIIGQMRQDWAGG